jgi:hypothetical protein
MTARKCLHVELIEIAKVYACCCKAMFASSLVEYVMLCGVKGFRSKANSKHSRSSSVGSLSMCVVLGGKYVLWGSGCESKSSVTEPKVTSIFAHFFLYSVAFSAKDLKRVISRDTLEKDFAMTRMLLQCSSEGSSAILRSRELRGRIVASMGSHWFGSAGLGLGLSLTSVDSSENNTIFLISRSPSFIDS